MLKVATNCCYIPPRTIIRTKPRASSSFIKPQERVRNYRSSCCQEHSTLLKDVRIKSLYVVCFYYILIYRPRRQFGFFKDLLAVKQELSRTPALLTFWTDLLSLTGFPLSAENIQLPSWHTGIYKYIKLDMWLMYTG